MLVGVFLDEGHVAVLQCGVHGVRVGGRVVGDDAVAYAACGGDGVGDDHAVRWRGVGWLGEPDMARGVSGEVFGRPVIADAALAQDEHVWAGLGDVVEDVGGQDHGAVAAEAGEQRAEAHAFLGVESGGGFVHDDEPGVAHEGLGDADAAAHASGEAADAPVGHVREPDPVDELVRLAHAFPGVVDAFEDAHVVEEFERGELRVGFDVLRQVAERAFERAAGPRVLQIVAVHEHLARCGADDAGEDAHERGFACAVRSDQADHAVRQVAGHVVQCAGLPREVLGQVVDGDEHDVFFPCGVFSVGFRRCRSARCARACRAPSAQRHEQDGDDELRDQGYGRVGGRAGDREDASRGRVDGAEPEPSGADGVADHVEDGAVDGRHGQHRRGEHEREPCEHAGDARDDHGQDRAEQRGQAHRGQHGRPGDRESGGQCLRYGPPRAVQGLDDAGAGQQQERRGDEDQERAERACRCQQGHGCGCGVLQLADAESVVACVEVGERGHVGDRHEHGHRLGHECQIARAVVVRAGRGDHAQQKREQGQWDGRGP